MPYIFLHGLGQDFKSWDKVISYLHIKEHVNCPDLSLLLTNKDMTYANLYDSFANYCNQFTEPLDLCGLSLGGLLALNYTIDNPSKVNSLILIGVPYKMPKTLLQIQNILFHFMPKSSFQNIGFKKKDFIRLTNSMINLDFTSSLKKISCKTMIVCGDKDYANKKAAVSLSDNILGANIHFIEHAGHEVNTDAPKQLAILIKKFILSA